MSDFDDFPDQRDDPTFRVEPTRVRVGEDKAHADNPLLRSSSQGMAQIIHAKVPTMLEPRPAYLTDAHESATAVPLHGMLNKPWPTRDHTDARSENRNCFGDKIHPPDPDVHGKVTRHRLHRSATRPNWQSHDLLTTGEAAEYLGLSPKTLRNRRVAAREYDLPFVRLGHGGRRRPVRYRFSEILAFLQSAASTSDTKT